MSIKTPEAPNPKLPGEGTTGLTGDPFKDAEALAKRPEVKPEDEEEFPKKYVDPVTGAEVSEYKNGNKIETYGPPGAAAAPGAPSPNSNRQQAQGGGGGQELGLIGGTLVGAAQATGMVLRGSVQAAQVGGRAALGTARCAAGVAKTVARGYVAGSKHLEQKRVDRYNQFTNNLQASEQKLRDQVSAHESNYGHLAKEAREIRYSPEIEKGYETPQERRSATLKEMLSRHPELDGAAYLKSSEAVQNLALDHAELLGTAPKHRKVMAGASAEEQAGIKELLESQVGEGSALDDAAKVSGIDGEKDKSFIQKMKEATERLTKMIEEFLDTVLIKLFQSMGIAPK